MYGILFIGIFFVIVTDAAHTAKVNLFSVTDITPTKIKLSWEMPNTNSNESALGYEIHYGDPWDDKIVIVHNIDQTRAVLSDLKPATPYMIGIQMYNRTGKGPETVLLVMTAIEGIPSKPRITHISERRPRSFCVNWEPPTEPSGWLTGYTLRLIHPGGTTEDQFINGYLTNPMADCIFDLKPYTLYKVQVAASTRVGNGKFSDLYPAMTDVAAPSPPRNLKLRGLNDRSVHLKWDVPAIVYRRVDYYLITLRNRQGEVLRETINGNLTMYTTTRLPKGSRFYVKVAALTKSLYNNSTMVGEFTDSITFDLKDDALDAQKVLAHMTIVTAQFISMVLGVATM